MERVTQRLKDSIDMEPFREMPGYPTLISYVTCVAKITTKSGREIVTQFAVAVGIKRDASGEEKIKQLRRSKEHLITQLEYTYRRGIKGCRGYFVPVKIDAA